MLEVYLAYLVGGICSKVKIGLPQAQLAEDVS